MINKGAILKKGMNIDTYKVSYKNPFIRKLMCNYMAVRGRCC